MVGGCYALDMYIWGVHRHAGRLAELLVLFADAGAWVLPLVAAANLAYTWARGRFDASFRHAPRLRLLAGRLAFYQLILQLVGSGVILSTPHFS